jgi:hypothetical protein
MLFAWRLPHAWVQRLGQLTYDPVSDKGVHMRGTAGCVLVCIVSDGLCFDPTQVDCSMLRVVAAIC